MVLLLHPLRPQAQQLIGFNLVRAGTNRTVAPLWDGAVIVFPPNLTATGLAIDALTTGGPIASVVFGYNTTRNYSVEKLAPYAMCGNSGTNFFRCTFLTVGTHRINVTISNVPNSSRVITFTLVNASSIVNASSPLAAPALVPMAVPVAAPIAVVPVPRPIAVPVPTPQTVPVFVPLPTPPVPLPIPVAAPVPIRPTTAVPAPIPLPTPTTAPVAPPVIAPVLVTRTSVPTVAPRVVPVLPPVFTIAAPVTPPPTSVPPILTFTLIYTVNNTDIMPLVNGSVVPLSWFDAAKFNIRADSTNRTLIQSIRFLPSSQSETSQPWAYCGNSGPIYNPCADLGTAGNITITARPYAGKYLTGTVLPDVTITFQFVGRPGPPVESQFPMYISCGGGAAITDSSGRIWRPDMYFFGGSTYANAAVDIVNKVGVDELIYKSERYGNFVYDIPVPLGSYSVVLHFAEI
jgi:Malectin domain